MAFLNPSFELEGAKPGCPSGWVFAAHAQHAFVAFGADEEPWEGFENGWSNDSYKYAFLGVDILAAEYTTASPQPKPYENFEEFWSGNQSYVYGISGAQATYDTANENFEDFEEEWDSNESYVYNFAGTAADFDGALQAFEDFEEEWDSNESYVYNFAGTAATYDGPVSYEDFEGTWDLIASIP